MSKAANRLQAMLDRSLLSGNINPICKTGNYNRIKRCQFCNQFFTETYPMTCALLVPTILMIFLLIKIDVSTLEKAG